MKIVAPHLPQSPNFDATVSCSAKTRISSIGRPKFKGIPPCANSSTSMNSINLSQSETVSATELAESYRLDISPEISSQETFGNGTVPDFCPYCSVYGLAF